MLWYDFMFRIIVGHYKSLSREAENKLSCNIYFFLCGWPTSSIWGIAWISNDVLYNQTALHPIDFSHTAASKVQHHIDWPQMCVYVFLSNHLCVCVCVCVRACTCVWVGVCVLDFNRAKGQRVKWEYRLLTCWIGMTVTVCALSCLYCLSCGTSGWRILTAPPCWARSSCTWEERERGWAANNIPTSLTAVQKMSDRVNVDFRL